MLVCLIKRWIVTWQQKTWFQHDRSWFLFEIGLIAGGVQLCRVAGDGKPYICPQGCEDDCEEWESGHIAEYGDNAKELVRIFREKGAVAVLLEVCRQGYDL
jgi:hypothetical protein